MGKRKTTIYLPEDIITDLDKEAEKEGLTRNAFLQTLIYESLRERKLVHFNMYDDHVTLWDPMTKNLVDVYIRDKKWVCGVCVSNECEHVRFTRKIPQVNKVLDKAGVVIR